MKTKPKYRVFTGSQAKRDLGVQAQVGGAKGGFDLSKKLAAEGKGAQAMQAAARVVAIRKARKSGDRGAYKTAVLANRNARLNYNQTKLGLHGNTYGKPSNTELLLRSKKGAKRMAKRGVINKSTQRGTTGKW